MTTAAPSNFVSIVYLPSHEVHFLAEFADDVVDEGIARREQRDETGSISAITRTIGPPVFGDTPSVAFVARSTSRWSSKGGGPLLPSAILQVRSVLPVGVVLSDIVQRDASTADSRIAPAPLSTTMQRAGA